MVDELGIVELIDTVIVQDHEQRMVSVGQAVKAMILNGLGFQSSGFVFNTAFFREKTGRSFTRNGD